MASLEDLKSLLTPALLTSLAEANIPFSKTEPLDFAKVYEESSLAFQEACKDPKARAALITLSRLAPDGTIPSDLDLKTFLPAPTSPDFPQQIYGLQLLLDQGSRILFSGIDDRWQSGFFGPLARQLAGQWHALPPRQRPDSWARWRDDVGASFDYWVVSRTLWSAPFLHAEDLESQAIGLELSEETRAAVEAHTGVTDGYRETRDELLKDEYAFLREVVKAPPRGEDGGLSMSSWAFWWSMILDSHWPIIELFGRYPYRNAILGRESTEKEKGWLDDVGHFSEPPPDVAKRIREDIEKGVWTPLGEE